MSIIKKLNLTHVEVLEVVKEWYTGGMFQDILQDEAGLDLEEICELEIRNLQMKTKTKKK
jgi:hypothetical protein